MESAIPILKSCQVNTSSFFLPAFLYKWILDVLCVWWIACLQPTRSMLDFLQESNKMGVCVIFSIGQLKPTTQATVNAARSKKTVGIRQGKQGLMLKMDTKGLEEDTSSLYEQWKVSKKSLLPQFYIFNIFWPNPTLELERLCYIFAWFLACIIYIPNYIGECIASLSRLA